MSGLIQKLAHRPTGREKEDDTKLKISLRRLEKVVEEVKEKNSNKKALLKHN